MVVRIGGFEVGGSNPFCLFAGPCVIETEAVTLATAEKLKIVCSRLSIPLVFKASYDKANRTSARSYRGPGLREGLRILRKVKEEFQVPVVSDIHEPREAGEAAGVLDVLQIPAFLCRQTDLLVAAARTGRVVNVKKGQFMAPEDTVHLVGKVLAARAGGEAGILITERGTSFGYHNLIVDFRGLQVMSAFAPVVFDATHSVQQPGLGEVSGGCREFVPLLTRAAVACGCAGLFLEVHPEPDKALSDGPNMLSLDALPAVLEQARDIDHLVKSGIHRPAPPGD